MAEVALGAVGLLGLFSSAVDTMRMVEAVVDKDDRLEILHTQLENQKARFLAWGDNGGNIKALEDMQGASGEKVCRAVEVTIKTIINVFVQIENLERRHGLVPKSDPKSPIWGSDIVPKALRSDSGSVWGQAHATTPSIREMSTLWLPAQAKPELRLRRSGRIQARKPYTAFRWAIRDANRFGRLIRDLRDLNDDLVKLSQSIILTEKPHLLGITADYIHNKRSLDVEHVQYEQHEGEQDRVRRSTSPHSNLTRISENATHGGPFPLPLPKKVL